MVLSSVFVFSSAVKYNLLCIFLQHLQNLSESQGIQHKPAVVMWNDITYMDAPLNY